MRVLVIGGGGREHALCWRLASSPSVEEVLCAPGNPGIAEVARLCGADPVDPQSVVDLALTEGVDLVVVGPEAPLVAGVADALAAADVPVVGPTAEAARLESSKSFAKEVMREAGVATAESWAGAEVAGALAALDRFGPPYVVKADGLAAGKGVVVTHDRAEAEAAVHACLVEGAFGAAGESLVVEAFLKGPEVSLLALCDGETVVPLVPAQDHKRLLNGDHGPNTGGMGAFSPVPRLGADFAEQVTRDVLEPVVAALRRRGVRYSGVLYAGLVRTTEGVRVLEFNARFGDPEAQVVLPRLRSDLGALLAACAHGELGGFGPLDWDPRRAVTVVLACEGYPGPYPTGRPISGLPSVADLPDVSVFHSGTRRTDEGLVTDGGRVMAVTGLGRDLAAARTAAYAAADRITFQGVQRRSDIAASSAASTAVDNVS